MRQRDIRDYKLKNMKIITQQKLWVQILTDWRKERRVALTHALLMYAREKSYYSKVIDQTLG